MNGTTMPMTTNKTKRPVGRPPNPKYNYQYPAMTPAEYESVLDHFQLTNVDLAKVIGVKKRQVVRYRNGKAPIPESIAKLLRLAVNYGFDQDDICMAPPVRD
jgi:hypothetical protein